MSAAFSRCLPEGRHEMGTSYMTLKQEACDEFIERKSRFIGYARPVTVEEEAIAFINRKKKEHWDATHNVYAYVLREGQIQRCSDDGEPQGTAGYPVLDVLLKAEITDCVVVVTRYFGGILLGTGGLVRAYSHGASLAVAAAQPLVMHYGARCRVSCGYAAYGMVAALVASFNGVVEDTAFTEEVTLTFLLGEEDMGPFQKALTEGSAGTLLVEEMEKLHFSLQKSR